MASEELLGMIDQWVTTMMSSAQLAQDIMKKAESEGLGVLQVRDLVFEAFKKRGLSDRSAYRNLPFELKNIRRVEGSRQGMLKHYENNNTVIVEKDDLLEDEPVNNTVILSKLETELAGMREQLKTEQQEKIELQSQLDQTKVIMPNVRHFTVPAWAEVKGSLLYFHADVDIINQTVSLAFDEKRSRLV